MRVTFDEDDEDELLARVIAGSGASVGRPAGRGTAKPARFLRKTVFEYELPVSMPPEAAALRVRQAVLEQGEIVHIEGAGEDAAALVIGLVGSGAMNLNPTVVSVAIHPAPQGSRLAIRGAAMEGLIKQRAAAKAAKRLAAALETGPDDSRP
jgi:hypothetical protein